MSDFAKELAVPPISNPNIAFIAREHATTLRKGGRTMISKSLALQVLNAALATGGDYAEIYAEQNDSDIVMTIS